MSLGATISRLRAEKKLSQGELADALGVSRQSVSKWETDASIPELDKLVKLSQLFGVTLDELVTGETLPEPVPSPVPLPRQMHGQKIAAIILLCMAFLVWLVPGGAGRPAGRADLSHPVSGLRCHLLHREKANRTLVRLDIIRHRGYFPLFLHQSSLALSVPPRRLRILLRAALYSGLCSNRRDGRSGHRNNGLLP